jgi:hypothetical protein
MASVNSLAQSAVAVPPALGLRALTQGQLQQTQQRTAKLVGLCLTRLCSTEPREGRSMAASCVFYLR